jgi:peptidoglycan hydrolase-like protein with peptidoglycan-binding domain
MQPRKIRILSAITAGGLALAVAGITAGSGTSHPATHAALAAQTESFPPVNLDACPTLHIGYPTGGCVAQLQTDLNIIQGNHLAVDGTFGSTGSQTYQAVIAFQQARGLQPDGMVGPATRQALDAALPVAAPTVPPTTSPVPAPSATAPSTPADTAAPSTPAPPLQYVAMGDSYSSGEGLAPFLPGTDTPADTCHRSDQAYSQYVTPKPDAFVACSGQTTAAVTNTAMSGQEPPQASLLGPNTGLVTFTFGGNDVGWDSALEACVKVQEEVFHNTIAGNSALCNQQLNELPGRIAMMEQNLIITYETMLELAPNAQVRVLNYPPLFPDRGGNTSGCRIGRFTAPGIAWQLVIAHDVEQKFVALEQQANTAIAAAVSQVQSEDAGGDRLQLVDVDPQFGGYTGHTSSCGDTGRPTPWINSVRMSSTQAAVLALDVASGNRDKLGTDLSDIIAASFHPTHEGQHQMYLALSAELPSGWH